MHLPSLPLTAPRILIGLTAIIIIMIMMMMMIIRIIIIHGSAVLVGLGLLTVEVPRSNSRHTTLGRTSVDE
jgi:hypothetical protein